MIVRALRRLYHPLTHRIVTDGGLRVYEIPLVFFYLRVRVYFRPCWCKKPAGASAHY